ncbi:MAG: polyribonucleotide nucleotidyltransferase [Anaerolineae bacterium]
MNAYEAKIGEHMVRLETGALAGQAGGAVTVRSSDTVVLATATASKKPREGIDFLPLTVDYEERLYAAGKIPGGFFKREGRPSEQAILLCRLTDRSLRPLFHQGMRHEVQAIITALSADQETYLDILALIGASAALTISNIPWDGPIGAVRVGMVNGAHVFNPTAAQMEESPLDLRLAGTRDRVLMVEAKADELSEAQVLDAIQGGHEAIQDTIALQERMRAEVGKPKTPFPLKAIPEKALEAVQSKLDGGAVADLPQAPSKEDREAALDELREEIVASLSEKDPDTDWADAFKQVIKKETRGAILEQGQRPDGRRPDEIRALSAQVGFLPRTHGSGLFSRGETQVLTIATLGTRSDEQRIDGLTPLESKRFMHHYNFPPYSTGETWFLRGPKRREIGHGSLAETALSVVLPEEDDFPYTIRLVSEVLSSNGSTSMASVCASTLALMDAGVPIASPVAGIAMGLVQDGTRHAVLTDIAGMEDQLGDMDFKVAGTRKGITALQLDVKVAGLDSQIMEQALDQSHRARLQILDSMAQAIGEPRSELSPFAPRITILKVSPEKIGAVIGPGGKTIRSIIAETGVKIDVEDDGSVFIASADGPSSQRAIEMVQALTEEPEIGKTYSGVVRRTTDFGAFVEILPGQDGLVHISQLADYRVPSVEDVVKVGDEIMVMVIDIDDVGKIRLSRQAVLEGWTAEEARSRDRKPAGRPSSRGRAPGGRPPRGRPRRPRPRPRPRRRGNSS